MQATPRDVLPHEGGFNKTVTTMTTTFKSNFYFKKSTASFHNWIISQSSSSGIGGFGSWRWAARLRSSQPTGFQPFLARKQHPAMPSRTTAAGMSTRASSFSCPLLSSCSSFSWQPLILALGKWLRASEQSPSLSSTLTNWVAWKLLGNGGSFSQTSRRSPNRQLQLLQSSETSTAYVQTHI